MAVAVVSIPVADPQAALAFYRDRLRLAVPRDEPTGPEMGSSSSRRTAARFALLPKA